MEPQLIRIHKILFIEEQEWLLQIIPQKGIHLSLQL